MNSPPCLLLNRIIILLPELALDHLETAEERRSPIVPWFRSLPILADPFEGHPRFEALNRKIFGPGA
jgi:hypothetical protein